MNRQSETAADAGGPARARSRAGVEALARECRRRLGPPARLRLTRILHGLGCRVSHGLGPEGPDGRPLRLAVAFDGTSRLHLNATSSIPYDVETMGAALYHLALDRAARGPSTGRRDVMAWVEAGGDPQERRDAIEALWFMQELLLPGEAFGAADPERAAALASRHGVTASLARHRMGALAARRAA